MAVVKQYLPYATSGSGFHASNERVTFRGIGEDDAPVDVRIRWPDGGEQVFRNVLPDSQYRIVQHPAIVLGGTFRSDPPDEMVMQCTETRL